MFERQPAIVRHRYLPRGTAFAFRHPDGIATVIVPPDATDAAVARATTVVEEHSSFARMMARFQRVADG